MPGRVCGKRCSARRPRPRPFTTRASSSRSCAIGRRASSRETPFPFDAVCVHAIATRLYPDLPRQSLRALAGYLGHSLDLARRSLGHVEATAFVWRSLCAELATRDIVTWERLQAWLGERAPAKTRAKKPRYPIASERYKSLPDAPGVYRFLRSNRDVLYVGKAASLKKRVTSHFIGRASKQLAPEMLTQVSEIEFAACEARWKPRCSKTTRSRRCARPTTCSSPRSSSGSGTARVISARRRPRQTRSISVGPLASQYSLRPLAALSELSSGAQSTPQLRSHAVGVSDLWTPDEAVFAAGLGRARRSSSRRRSRWPRRDRGTASLQLAKQLLLSAPNKAAEEPENSDKPEGWDAERVARHIERAVAQAYQAYRRARFLQLLHDCDIVYREPDGAQARLLRIRDGALVEASEASLDWAPSERARPVAAAAQLRLLRPRQVRSLARAHDRAEAHRSRWRAARFAFRPRIVDPETLVVRCAALGLSARGYGALSAKRRIAWLPSAAHEVGPMRCRQIEGLPRAADRALAARVSALRVRIPGVADGRDQDRRCSTEP